MIYILNPQKLKKKEYNDKKHKEWNKKIINADDYDENIQAEKKVKVAIIDSGINFDVRFDVKENYESNEVVNVIETNERAIEVYEILLHIHHLRGLIINGDH